MTAEKDLWNKNKWILYFAIALLLAWLLHKCHNSEPNITTETVTTKEVKGTFEAVKPVNEPIGQKVSGQNLSNVDTSNNNVDTSKNQPSGNSEQLELIRKLLLENSKLAYSFKSSNDSLKQALYNQAIQLNNFSQTFEDTIVKIDVSGVSRGTVESLKANYTVKPQKLKVEVKQKQRVFALKTGVEYGNTTVFDKGVFKANIEFENKKGNSFSYSYDTDKRHWLGYKRTIFDIKR